MSSISYDEACALMALPKFCDAGGGGAAEKSKPDALVLFAGLLDDQGRTTAMVIKLHCHSDQAIPQPKRSK